MFRQTTILTILLLLADSSRGRAEELPVPSGTSITIPADTTAVESLPELEAGEKGTLYWANGDSLPGQLVRAEGEQLDWKTVLFVDPLQLNANFLKTVIFDRAREKRKIEEDFRVVFRNGDAVYANIKGIDEKHIFLESSRHGDLQVLRQGVRVARRISNQSLLFLGPSGIEDWKTLTQGGAFERWKASTEGNLVTTGWLAELFRELEIPGQVEIELSLKSSDKPRFLIAFSNKPDDSVRLETWDDELVALAGDDFEPILTLGANRQEVQLRLYWNRLKGELAVYAPSGKKLGAISGAALGEREKSGLYLRNKGSHLELTKLRVSKWNGAPPQIIREGETRLHLADGKVVYGRINQLKADDGLLDVNTPDGDKQLKFDQVDRIYLADDEADLSNDGLVQAAYFDGTRVTGAMTRIADGTIGLKAIYSDKPIVSSLNGARQLTFRPKEKLPADGPDRLYCQGGVLRGTLAGGNEPAIALQWRPVGGLNSSALAPGSQARFVRGQRATDVKYDAGRFSDMLFLTTRDVLPCRVTKIDEQFIYIETTFSEKSKVPVAFVKAIELATLGGSGFGDAGWRQLSGDDDATEQGPEQIVFNRPAAYGHPRILNGDEIEFSVNWKGRSPTQMMLTLFTDQLDPKARTADLQFTFFKDQVTVSGPTQGAVKQTFQGGQLSRNAKAKVRVRVKGSTLQVFLNGNHVHTQRMIKGRAGNGLILDVKPGQFSRLQYAQLTLSEFEIRESKERERSNVADTALTQALTIPRFRRDNPSTHVLIAPNGDLLRGRLTGMEGTRLRFQSRLDEFHFDRSRVTAVVWLHPEEEQEPPGWDESLPVVRVVMGGDLMIVLNPQRMDKEKLFGTSPLLGQCEVPIVNIRELHAGGFGPIDDQRVYANWTPVAAPEPKIPGAEGEGGGSTGFDSPLVGKPAPDFEVSLLDGKKVRLSSLRGKVVVLDFWATWCAPCIKALPVVEESVKPYAKDVLLYGVNQEEQPDQIKQFLKTRNLALTVALDRDGSIARKYGIDGIPQTIIVDREGIVSWHGAGYRADLGAVMDAQLKKVLDLESTDAPADGDADEDAAANEFEAGDAAVPDGDPAPDAASN